MDKARWQRSREIVERFVVEGDLVLETPALLGGGDTPSLVDMPLLLDPLEGRALLTGSSLAGALRSYLRERQYGYAANERADALGAILFGHLEDQGGEQSSLIVSDALAEGRPDVELRDGVALEGRTRTAEEHKKYDYELLAAGTHFPLHLELLVRAGQKEKLCQALAIALQGLERGEIMIGGRRRRGLGQCRVGEWRIRHYDLVTPEGLCGWLADDRAVTQSGSEIATLLSAQGTDLDERSSFEIRANFALDGSLLIRSGSGQSADPDMVHLRSRRLKGEAPILSGTSLAGALRARALRIARTVGHAERAQAIVARIFGPRIESPADKPRAGHLWAEESAIDAPLELVQSRVKIDRFTGGSFPTALFSEQPVFGTKDTRVTVTIRLQFRADAPPQETRSEIGLLLLLLKDLWTGDLPLGGESSVGRGRLAGRRADLTLRSGQSKGRWTLVQEEGAPLQAAAGQREPLQEFVDAFVREVAG